jgi:hypothetical protein
MRKSHCDTLPPILPVVSSATTDTARSPWNMRVAKSQARIVTVEVGIEFVIPVWVQV